VTADRTNAEPELVTQLRVAVAETPRLALRPHEAAEALGCSRDFFDEHIGPELRWIRRGRIKLVAVTEVQRWLDGAAARTLEGER
jgi:hypothetical protein